MGSGKGGGRNTNINVNQIPTSSKSVIQSIKEIVDFPDDEIYLVLKDCNMDAYEAVNRLLSQDTFHEVKSKREKKKETKDVTDSRSRGNSSTSTRGSRGGGVDRYSSRNSTSQFVSSDYGAQRGKPVYKKETVQPEYRNSTMGGTGNYVNSWQTVDSDASMDKSFPVNPASSILPIPQPSGIQSAWSGMPGQVSMADIVKMGRPLGKASSNLNASQREINSQQDMPPLPAVSKPHDSHISQNYAPKVNSEPGIAGYQNLPSNDDWPQDEEPPYEITRQQFQSEDDMRYKEGNTVDDEHATFAESVPGSNQNLEDYNSISASGFDNELYQDDGSYQVNHHEVEDPNVPVSSLTNNFESISFPNEDEETQSEEEDAQSEDDGPAVKIPEHLQVNTTNVAHLSFGSFGHVQSNEEVTAPTTDAPAVGHSESRNSEYYDDSHLGNASDGNNAPQFEVPSVSQTEILQQVAQEVAPPNQYSFPSSTANYTFENSQQLNSPFAHLAANSHMMQGLPSLGGVMPYSNSLPSSLLASNMQPLREADLAYSQFPISQAMAAKYGNSASSLTAASMAELLKTANLAAQPTQNLSDGSVSGPTGLPQHLAMHPYSQHTLPLNMMGYPFLPQTYTYMPPGFQQAFATGNSAYPQSLAAGFPQFKNDVSANNMQQSSSVPSGYGGFANSNNIPRDFPLNPPQSAPSGNSMNYEDVLASQYKDANHLLSLQQGAGSRTMSGVPGSTYYSFQGQNQQQQQQPQPPAGFRQNQQPSQHYGPMSGYPNYYHSQPGHSLEQMSRDGGSQGQLPKQTQQHLWKNNY